MAKNLSEDLRVRVIGTVDGGLSRHAAAARIEALCPMILASIEALLRKAAARTIDELWNAIRDAITGFSPADCANCFTATGDEPK